MAKYAFVDDHGDDSDNGRSISGHPKNYAWPCLLLVLEEAPAHGYELIERLRPLGFEACDPPNIYKSLRHMERERLVTSKWEVSSHGPAKRIYSLTRSGSELLEGWALKLRQERNYLNQFLAHYQRLDCRARLSGAGDRAVINVPDRAGLWDESAG